MKLNCWEFKKCGRTPRGVHSNQLGVCPVTTYTALNGVHGGMNGGRSCWVVAGSFCGGEMQVDSEQKLAICRECDFLILVRSDEEQTHLGFLYTRLGMDRFIARSTARRAAALSGATYTEKTVTYGTK